TLIIATDRGQTSTAKIASMRAATKREREANNALIRVDGEIVTMAEAVDRTGRDARSLRQKYREGQRTWAKLTC
ncbi:MAG: hypothetical protein AB7O86_12340, partial [Porticoccaceae bacterium]